MTTPNQIRITAEVALEDSVVSGLRQMVVGMSITIAVLAYFEANGNIMNNYIALSSVILLFVTSIMVGIMSIITYNRRRNLLLEDGIINIDRTINKWYIFVGITTVSSLLGISVAIIMNKYKNL
mgnify:CR=1 FL=1